MAGTTFFTSITVFEDNDYVFSLASLLEGQGLPDGYLSTIDSIALTILNGPESYVVPASLIDSNSDGIPDTLGIRMSTLPNVPNVLGGAQLRIELGTTGSNAEPDLLDIGLIIRPVNDAPEGTDKTIEVPTDSYVLTTGDFGFRDPVEQNAFKSVVITTLPTQGQLLLDGQAVTAGQEILASDIDAKKLSFAVPPGTAGDITMTFQLRDNGGVNQEPKLSASERGSDLDLSPNTLTFKAAPVNTPPQAVDDTAETKKGQSVDIAVRANDIDTDNDTLTVTTATDGTNGTVTIDRTTGNPVYVPNGGFVGTDSFTYTVSDNRGGSDQATVFVTVKDAAPGAAPSAITGIEDTPYIFAPADFKGTNPNGDIATVSIETLPLDGELQVSIGGAWVKVAAGQQISTAEINLGHLRFVPDLNESSAPCDAAGVGNFREDYARFDFALQNSAGLKGATSIMNVDITPVADQPTLTLTGAPSGLQDTVIAIPKISAATTDTDGSETLSLVVGSIPVGAILSDGSMIFTAVAASTSVDVWGWDLENLTIKPPAGFVGKITLNVTATATENCNEDKASNAGILTVAVLEPPKPATIGDRVWEDKNANGIQDIGEKGMNGVTVELRDSSGAVIQTATTSGDGNYSFSVAAGTYKVSLIKPQSYMIVSPKDQGASDDLDSDFDPATLSTAPITVTAGQAVTNVDAGLYCKAQVGDRVWLDSNRNGIQDSGEAGFANVTVQLKNAAGAVVSTQVTDAYGHYNFANLDAGQYSIQFVAPKNYSFTTPNIGSDLTDSDALPMIKGSTNLIVNGSFEAPDQFLGVTGFFLSIPSWTGKGDKIEIGGSSNYGVTGVTGDQVLELDALNTFSSITGVATGVYQDVATQAGELYELSLDVAARAATSLATNTVEVWWRGAKVATIDPTSTKLQTFTFQVQGSGGKDRLEFREAASDDDSLGGIIDNVRLYTLTPEGSTELFTLENCQIKDSVDAGLYKTPVTATVEGANSIYEGKSGTYNVKLDKAVDTDTWYKVQIADGTAHRVDQYAGNQDIILGGFYNVWDGLKFVNIYNRVPNGNSRLLGDRPAVGPGDVSWDYTVYNSAAQINKGDFIMVKIAAGQTVSESFSISGWQEKVTIDRDLYPNGYAEGTENFKLSIAAITGADQVSAGGPLAVSIFDTTTYNSVSPIVIDLNGDGIQTTALGQTAGLFDMLNDGRPVNTGWLSGQDGFLAIDANGNGIIDNRNELFGGKEGEGFAKLATFDCNGDGVINRGDRTFDQLRIWQDSNENHRTDAGELKSLTEAGVTELRVDFTIQEAEQYGNKFLEHSTATLANGTEVDMVDVYFNIASSSGAAPVAAGTPALGEILGGDTDTLDDVLPGLGNDPSNPSSITSLPDSAAKAGTLDVQALQSLIELQDDRALVTA